MAQNKEKNFPERVLLSDCVPFLEVLDLQNTPGRVFFGPPTGGWGGGGGAGVFFVICWAPLVVALSCCRSQIASLCRKSQCCCHCLQPAGDAFALPGLSYAAFAAHAAVPASDDDVLQEAHSPPLPPPPLLPHLHDARVERTQDDRVLGDIPAKGRKILGDLGDIPAKGHRIFEDLRDSPAKGQAMPAGEMVKWPEDEQSENEPTKF